MRRINPTGWFFIVFLITTVGSGMWKYFDNLPEGMHQGAQTDRASVAWNYYRESYHFFEPRVMETRSAEGVTGMEFPLVNYLAGICYTLFGAHEIWYRIVVFLFTFFGLYFTFQLTAFFIRKTYNRVFLVFGWFLSPLFVFYGNSFLPDPVALSITLAALHFFFSYYFLQQRKYLWYYLCLTSIAALIKITFLIPHFGIAFLYILNVYKPALLPGGFPRNREAGWYFIIPLIPAATWYFYSGWLSKTTGNMHFLQQISPAKSVPEFLENTRYGFNTWQESIYPSNYLYLIIAFFLITLFTQWRKAPLLSWFSGILTLGFIVAFILFNFQFRYHDYYYFLLLLPVFFMLLFMQQVFLEGRQMFTGIVPVLMLVAFYILPISNYIHAAEMLQQRYTKGTYYYQSAFPEAGFYPEFSKEIQSYIPDTAHIISAFDASPNTSLYLLKRKGIRIARDFPAETVRELFQKYPYHYLVINDSLSWENEYQPTVACKKKLLYRKGLLYLYKLEYPAD